MQEYNEATYGDKIAIDYDALYPSHDPAMIDVLTELTDGGNALELGIGTGRVALPLQENGVTVCGIDASEAMVSKLRSKPGGDDIEIQVGSFADFNLDARFQLIYVVFNTFFALLTQKEQVQCFRSVREHLAPSGFFLIEAFVPDLCRFVDQQTVRVVEQLEDAVRIEVSQLKLDSQQVRTHHILLSQEGIRMFPVRIRYAWPSELDLMAQIAGLSLRDRWASWDKAAFTRNSKMHISVYRSDEAE